MPISATERRLRAATTATAPIGSRLTESVPRASDARTSRSGFRYSDGVARKTLEAHGLSDLVELVRAAARFDDGNLYLNRSELQLGAKALKARAEVGVVSDLDLTLIPEGSRGTFEPRPYPGAAALLNALEYGEGGAAGDTHYVTARLDKRVAHLPAFFAANGLPNGTIDTGNRFAPWDYQREKIRDITRLLKADPTKKFVLIGDSSMKDPEVYRAIQTKFPEQVAAIVINKTTHADVAQRFDGMLLTETYAHAAAGLYRKGVLTESSARQVMKAAQAEGVAITDAEIDALLSAD